MDKQNPRLTEVTWHQVKKEVFKINPKLGAIIEESKPSPKHTFIKARYPFGVNIRQDSKLYLPLETGEVVSFDNVKIPQDIQNKLRYSVSPLGLILDKNVEVYVETPEKRSIPFKLFSRGTIFGVWEIMEMPKVAIRSCWDFTISSGAKTIFMLPKISDTHAHARLRDQLHIQAFAPDTIYDHHKIFSQIAKAKYLESPWDTEVLFFTEAWLAPQEKNLGWVKLREYWLQEAWRQFLQWTSKVALDFNWETYSNELRRRKIKLNHYLLETTKHLISIARGTIPGFSIAISEQTAPIALLQDTYVQDYGLKHYAPIILCPEYILSAVEKNIEISRNLSAKNRHFNCAEYIVPNNSGKSVYYSLQSPSLPGRLAEDTEFSSTMKILREIKMLMDVFFEMSNQWPQLSTGVFDFNNAIQFDYFHNEKDKFEKVQSIQTLLREDPSLLVYPKKYGEREFPEATHFFRGCVRINLKGTQ